MTSYLFLGVIVAYPTVAKVDRTEAMDRDLSTTRTSRTWYPPSGRAAVHEAATAEP